MSRTQTLSIPRLGTVSCILLFSASLAAEQFTGVDYAGDVFRMDSETGATTFIGPSGHSNVNSMARDSIGMNYVIGEDALGASQLVRLDPLTGAGTSALPLSVSRVTGAAFGPGDVLYVVTYPTALGRGSDLHTVDVATGIATPVGYTASADGLQGLTFLDGILYAWDIGHPGLVTIDIGTAQATPVGLTAPFFTSVQALLVSSAGELYGVGNELHLIDPASGGVTWLGTSDYYARGMEVTSDFIGSPAYLSVQAGGTQFLQYDAGPAFAGESFLVLGTASGTAPGITYRGVTVPLNPDSYLLYTLLNPLNPLLPQGGGALDANGSVQLGFILPAASSAALVGLTVHHSGVTLRASGGAVEIAHASFPSPLTFIP